MGPLLVFLLFNRIHNLQVRIDFLLDMLGQRFHCPQVELRGEVFTVDQEDPVVGVDAAKAPFEGA